MSVVDVQTIPSGTRKHTVVVLCVLAAAALFFTHLDLPLLEPEEALYAEVPREMLVAGSWLVPVHRGQPYYEKPPLFSWLIMACYGVFGVHEWAARLIPASAALATVLITFWWGRRMFGLRAGFLGAMILCLSPRFVHQARMITMDGLLCLWITAALALGQQAIASGRFRWPYWILSAVACGLGLLTKGPTALILTAVPLLAYQLLRRNEARPRFRSWLAYFAAAAGVALPWYVAMIWRDPSFLREFFWTHHVLLRFVQPMHEEPLWFYVPVLPLGMLPWSVLLLDLLLFLRWARGSPLSPVLGGEGSGVRGPATTRLAPLHPYPSPPEYRGRGEEGSQLISGELRGMGLRTEVLFLLASCAWCVLFFSVADCKRIGYILPAMPVLALALGCALDRRLEHGSRLPFWTTLGVLAAAISGVVLAVQTTLLEPPVGVVFVTLGSIGIGWTVRHRHGTPQGAWTACGVATFTVLLAGVFFIAPNYYERFSMCDEIRQADSANDPRLAVACYPHHWDSIGYYLKRDDVQVYDRASRARLLADLEHQPVTLVFVKTGVALNELLSGMSPALEFVTCGKARTVTAGLVRRRSSTNKMTLLRQAWCTLP